MPVYIYILVGLQGKPAVDARRINFLLQGFAKYPRRRSWKQICEPSSFLITSLTLGFRESEFPRKQHSLRRLQMTAASNLSAIAYASSICAHYCMKYPEGRVFEHNKVSVLRDSHLLWGLLDLTSCMGRHWVKNTALNFRKDPGHLVVSITT